MNLASAIWLLLLANLSSCQVSSRDDTADVSEYLGCYLEEPTGRLFVATPGDYLSTDITPVGCMMACGQYYRYAAISNGTDCFCANEVPVQRVTGSHCASICRGSTNFSADQEREGCGGNGFYISVYTMDQRIIGLKVMDPGMINVFSNVTIQAAVSNGIDLSYRFNSGDETWSQSFATKVPRINHVYNKPGVYKVLVEAASAKANTVTASRILNVVDAPTKVSIICPQASEFGFNIECHGEMKSGYDIATYFNFGDGAVEKLILNVKYDHVGAPVLDDQMLPSASRNRGFTVIMPDADFQADLVLTGWELLAAKPGPIILQIFQPTCSIGEAYCPIQRLCQSVGKTCGEQEKGFCKDSEFFCFARQRCLPDVENSLRTCLTTTNPRQYLLSTDYTLRHEFHANLDRVGYNFIHVNDERQVLAHKFDVIGWSAETEESGEVSYVTAALEDDKAQELELPLQLGRGSQVFRSGPSVMQRQRHMIRAHGYQISKFSLFHNYTTTGNFVVRSNISADLTVSIEAPISRLSLSCPSFEHTYQSFSAYVDVNEKASNVIYDVDFGNGTVASETSKTLSCFFATPGYYKIHVTARNALSAKSEVCFISVLDPIKGLSWRSNVSAVQYSFPSVIEWCVASGTNLTFLINFGDGATERIFAGENLCYARKHTFKQVGLYNISIEALNILEENERITTSATVQFPISKLDVRHSLPCLTNNVFVKLNEAFQIFVDISQGTDVSCTYDFGEGFPKTMSLLTVNHSYSQTGTYKIAVTCKNLVSTVSTGINSSFVVQILEPITGLVLKSDRVELGSPARIEASLQSGTLFRCKWNLGDGTLLQSDPIELKFPLTYEFQQPGDYNVELTCVNELGELRSNTIVSVDEPVTGLAINCPKRYHVVTEKLLFNISVQRGSRTYFRVNFGDQTERTFPSSPDMNHSFTLTHQYAQDGEYRVSLTAWNTINMVNVSCTDLITVEYPVSNISLQTKSPLRFDTGPINVFYKVEPGGHAPSNAFVRCQFDGGNNFVQPLPKYAPPESVICSYSTVMPGKYNISVSIYNAVSRQDFILPVVVQRPEAVEINVYQTAGDAIVPGFGPERNTFKLERILMVNVTSQDGDHNYTFNFGDGSQSIASKVPAARHLYRQPGTYNISAIVENMLERIHAWLVIHIQESILNMHFQVLSTVHLGEPLRIDIQADQYGSNTCVVLDFSDGVRYMYNRDFCSSVQDSGAYIYQSNNNERIGFEHYFNARGSYLISIQASNLVSSFEMSKAVEVVFKRCQVPDISIYGAGSFLNPVLVKRTDPVTLSANVTLDCEGATHATFLWIALAISELGASLELYASAVNITGNNFDNFHQTSVVIPSRTLPYGLVQVQLRVTFASSRDNVSSILGLGKTWLNVIKTPLKAIISGGFKRGIGHESATVLDASLSTDPDDSSMEGLTFSWFCRRKTEDFPSGYDAKKSENLSTGCLGNGKFTLTENTQGVSMTTKSGSIISINPFVLSPASQYVVRVIIEKAGRVGSFDQELDVLPGAPPTVTIVCVYNCIGNIVLSPHEPLKVLGVCTDCLDNSLLSYRWSLREVLNDSITLPVDELESKSSTGQDKSNFALKSDVLKLGQAYTIKLTAWKLGGNEENGGYAEFFFVVNEPPSSGACDLTPREGVTLKTTFRVSCQGWTDRNLPLLYKIDSLRLGVSQNLYSGSEASVELILPIGDELHNYTYELLVAVKDSYFAGTQTSFIVKVTEPVAVDYGAITEDLDELASSGNLQSLSMMALAAGSVMNKASGAGAGGGINNNAKEVRERMIRSLGKVQPCTLSEIQQMGGVQFEMTKASEEITGEAQESCAQSLNAMSECMSKADASDPNLEGTAAVMFHATANVLEANKANEQNVTNVEGRSGADKAMDTVNKIGGAFLRQMVAGDQPRKIQAGRINIEMSQVAHNADEEDSVFKLPNIAEIYGNQSSTGNVLTSIGAMVTTLPDNPYNGADVDDAIKSEVSGLALAGANGEPINLLGQELTMFVKRNTSQELSRYQYEFDIEDGKMNVHKFNFSSEDGSMVIEIRPVDPQVNITVYIRNNERPTVSSFVTKYAILPHQGPYIRVFSAQQLNGTGEYYLGLRMGSVGDMHTEYSYNPVRNYTLSTWLASCLMWNEEVKKWSSSGCKVGPKTSSDRTQCICVIGYDEMEKSRFARALDEPAPAKKAVTRATFAGGFFPAPNPIDFSKAFAGFANLTENPVALATVLSIFGTYLVLLFWARREDRKDVAKAGVTALPENDPSDKQFFEITVYTGFGGGAATTSKVFFQLSGDEEESEPRELRDATRKIFQKRSEDIFLASFPDSLGDLQYLRIWIDNSGNSPSWYLSRVMVHDLNADRKYLFINDNQIAVETGDGSLERVLPVAGPDEIKTFNHLFFSTTQKNITDGHIWFSVFIRPPKSRFTRVQRLSCCLTLLYCTMITNAMFYEVAGESDPSTTIHLGPFAFSPSQIGIGIMTSLIIFPVNIFIVGVFRSVAPKPSEEELRIRKARSFWCMREFFFCCHTKSEVNSFMDLIRKSDDSKKFTAMRSESVVTNLSEAITLDGDIGLSLETDKQEKEREKRQKLHKKKRKLPYWMKYFAWGLLVLSSFASAFFVVLYGFQFGKEKSAQWISALFVSFFQDVFVSQPIKILCLGLFIALVVKKPADEDEDMGEKRQQLDEEFLHNDNHAEHMEKRGKDKVIDKKEIMRFKPPSKEKIAALREYRLKELKMYNVLRDLFLYVMFVVALFQVTYSNMDPQAFFVRKSLTNIFIDGSYGGKPFAEVSTPKATWEWLNTTVVRGLHATDWYNDQPNIPGFTQDLYSNLFAGARIRQLRIKDGTCKIADEFRSIAHACRGWYSMLHEDKGMYDLGWKQVSNETLHVPLKTGKAWHYQTPAELDTYPMVGSMAPYSGGGYVGDIGKNPRKAIDVIQELHDNLWIDSKTRVVILEATVYNAQVNLFAIMNFMVEFLPTNGVVRYHSIKVARLYTFGGSTESFTIACQFFVLFFFAIFVYREGKKIYREKRSYFQGFWNLIELSVIVLLIACLSVFFTRMLLVKLAVKKITTNPGAFVSFNKVVQWDNLFTALTGVVVLISCVKSIRLLQYNKTISLLASTLKGSAKPLAAFSIVFAIFYFAFTTFAFVIFVSSLETYKSFLTASETVLTLLLGGFDFGEIRDAQPILAPIWFIAIVLFGVMCIMNVFLSIIMDTYSNVKDDLSRQGKEHELVDFMFRKFMHLIGKGDGGKGELIERIEKAERARDERMRKANEKYLRKVHKPKTKTYTKIDDAEIEEKFSQLDQSLNGFWKNFGNDETIDDLVGRHYYNSYGFGDGYDAFNNDLRRQLEDELGKWQ